MGIITYLLLAGLVITEFIGMLIKKSAQVAQTVIRWSWESPLGALLAGIGFMVLWLKLTDQSISPFSASSSFLSILMVVAYLLRFVALIVSHDALEEPERPRHQPKKADDWCEPVSTH